MCQIVKYGTLDILTKCIMNTDIDHAVFAIIRGYLRNVQKGLK